MFTSIFKGALALLLSSFMALTAYSFLRFRIKKKEAEYRDLIRILDLSEDDPRFSMQAVQEEYSPNDYWVPVVFSTTVCLFGFSALLLGRELLQINAGIPSLLLTGVFQGTSEEIDRLRWQGHLVLSLGFVGAFIWSAQNIIRRLITADLTPGTYYGAGLRMVYAALVSLMLSLLLEVFPTNNYTPKLLPVIAFLTGMFPDNALRYLREKIHIFKQTEKKSHDLPLEMIEGVSVFHMIRLGEVGIDNGQNLAEANIIELILKTPFNPSQLIDWIAQAKLYVYFKDDIENLRRIGVRTIFDLLGACNNKEQQVQIAKEGKVPELSLSILCERIQEDKGITRLYEFQNLLSAVTGKQKTSEG